MNFGPNANEINLYHSEISVCKTAAIQTQSTSIAWNSFTDVWFLSDGTGLLNNSPEIRVTTCKFGGVGVAIQQNGNVTGPNRDVFTGNVFDSTSTAIKWTGTQGGATISDNILYNTGITINSIVGDIAISGNLFFNSVILLNVQILRYSIVGNTFSSFGSGTAVKFANGAGNDPGLVASNLFENHWASGTAVGVSIGNSDWNITITSNSFVGVAFPVTFGTSLKADTLNDNTGFNPIGKITNFVGTNVPGSTFAPWGTSSTVVASTDYQMDGTSMTITSTGGTGVSITIKDNLGNTIASGLTTLTAQQIPFGFKLNFGAFSVAPTVTVFAN